MSVSALRILAVDNEPSVTFSLRYIFTGPRYELSAVENGYAALARLDSGLERYDVIIVDEKMPHMTGVELVGELRKRGTASKIMVLSAYLSSDVRADYERMDVHVMFPKPFATPQLLNFFIQHFRFSTIPLLGFRSRLDELLPLLLDSASCKSRQW